MSEQNRSRTKLLPVFGFVGYSDSGKTTLAAEVVRRLEQAGVRVAVVKHDGHGHYKEAEGTDSSAYQAAGATSVLVASPESLVVYERRASVTLEDLVDRLSAEEGRYDLIISEGFKGSGQPKIAVARSPEDLGVLQRLGPGLVAIACSDGLIVSDAAVPMLNIDDPASVAIFILHATGLSQSV